MAKVLGLGGIFFKARDAKALRAWYRDVLGMDIHEEYGHAQLDNTDGTYGVFTVFAGDTKYFAPSEREFMVNLRVDDLDGLLAKLKERGAQVLDRREDGDYGKFGYVVDPEGTLLELFQPSSGSST